MGFKSHFTPEHTQAWKNTSEMPEVVQKVCDGHEESSELSLWP